MLQVAELCIGSNGMGPSLDIGAALKAAEALGGNMRRVVELLPHAKAGMMAGIAKRKKDRG